jgi:hypothetical protein
VLSVAVHPFLAGDWILARSSLNVFPRDVSPILCLHLMLCVYYGWESVHAREYRKGTDGAVVSLCFFKGNQQPMDRFHASLVENRTFVWSCKWH